MEKPELRRYIGQMLSQLADLADGLNEDDVGPIAFKLRLLADDFERGMAARPAASGSFELH